MKKLYFVLGVHNHQPVGNFEHVFEEGFQQAYWPFMEVLSRHPKIKWSLHSSGILWDYVKNKHPEYMDAVKKMVKSGQLELLTGGYYEPILSAIPDKDKKGQVEKLTEFIKKEFNFAAKGLWLTERVWEPNLAKKLNEAGIEYSVVDDAHFAASGFDVEKLKGYYVTEEEGCRLNIFPISQMMRYCMPFQTVEKTIEYMSSFADETGDCVIVMADDGEKFGMWPETNKHVYKNKWLENFINAVEKNSDWIETITFSEYMNKFPPKGRAYLPCASYFEMSEWSLPPASQEVFENIAKQFRDNPRVMRFLRGGFWRNFLSKYEESNNMHKKMLYVSDKIGKMDKTGNNIEKARQALYAGQCNCAYWHGVFGGLYLPHLRNAIYKELITADSLCFEESSEKESWTKYDFDCDGKKEVIYESGRQNIYFSPHNGGSVFEWDYIPKKINLLNTLTKRFESYHNRLKEIIAKLKRGETGVQPINEIVTMKENNLDDYLHYDWYRRTMLLDHFLHPDTKFQDLIRGQYAEQGDFVLGDYSYSLTGKSILMKRSGKVWEKDYPLKINIEKEIVPVESGMNVSYKIKNLEEKKIELSFSPEFNYSFSSFIEADKAETKSIRKWNRKDEHFKIAVNMEFSQDVNMCVFPVETVSLSEGGFERTYQGTVVFPVHKIVLAPGEAKKTDIKIVIENI